MARSGRVMALGPAHLAKVARPVEEGPLPDSFARLSDEDFKALAARLVAELEGQPFWIFAYGSLIWNPEFEHVEARRGTVHGWRRSFCLPIDNWRATPEIPGLMLALERGGSCTGVAYRMPDDDAVGRMLRLLRREIAYHENVAWLRWVTVRGPWGLLRALAFYCAPPSIPDLERLTREEQAHRLARAVGFMGSCAEYLHNTVDHLEALGIHDRYLWDLQVRVAAEIDGL
ncbi:gamma-glutamylcyclotransferase [Tabrizicola sp.]|uniref:gamma-glutamylcyclotransferase n=1 Tax=Tabrizicola sp. TaxID=2005166 RepID=UPI002FDD1F22